MQQPEEEEEKEAFLVGGLLNIWSEREEKSKKRIPHTHTADVLSFLAIAALQHFNGRASLASIQFRFRALLYTET